MIKIALRQSKEILDYLLDTDEDDFTPEQIQSAARFIKALNVDCECDCYNGFVCGCSHRSMIVNEALESLKLIK